MARRRANGMGTVYKVKGRNLKNPYKALVTLGLLWKVSQSERV